MWIKRDITGILNSKHSNLVQILIGPRQCGKSSLLWKLAEGKFSEITFDDMQLRNLATKDPQFFLEQQSYPLILDEVQYVPEIFPEIKKIVDQKKREQLELTSNEFKVIFRLTGSSQILLDTNIKESLAGRASLYYLNTLSVNEILTAIPSMTIQEIIYQGGWPELYTGHQSAKKYLNDYIRIFVEKDIVLSAGIAKQKEFNTVLGMLAARTGEFLSYSNIAQDSGVRSVTVKEWVSTLERFSLVYLLQPYSTNLNKRLVKTPKIYFLDTGIACRLQGWSQSNQMILSAQAGHLFETLVLAEIVKCINNFGKSWKLTIWRTKEKEEIDFILDNGNGKIIPLDAKMGIHSVEPESLPKSFTKIFPKVKELVLVSIGGTKKQLSPCCKQVPISELTTFLLEEMKE